MLPTTTYRRTHSRPRRKIEPPTAWRLDLELQNPSFLDFASASQCRSACNLAGSRVASAFSPPSRCSLLTFAVYPPPRCEAHRSASDRLLLSRVRVTLLIPFADGYCFGGYTFRSYVAFVNIFLYILSVSFCWSGPYKLSSSRWRGHRDQEMGQLVYLVLFSFAFFFDGITGLAITIGAILSSRRRASPRRT